jgi:HEPN domain-containing protein
MVAATDGFRFENSGKNDHMVSENVKRWLDRVDYDMRTAEAMRDTGRYIYAIFMCQQAIEKCFKALIVHRGGEALPIHNLRRLSELCEFKLDKQKLIKLEFLSQYYINARYQEDLAELSKGLTREVVEEFIAFSEETIEWLTHAIKS